MGKNPRSRRTQRRPSSPLRSAPPLRCWSSLLHPSSISFRHLRDQPLYREAREFLPSSAGVFLPSPPLPATSRRLAGCPAGHCGSLLLPLVPSSLASRRRRGRGSIASLSPYTHSSAPPHRWPSVELRFRLLRSQPASPGCAAKAATIHQSALKVCLILQNVGREFAEALASFWQGAGEKAGRRLARFEQKAELRVWA
ncbi:uncharacterized protein LOC121779391 [Salvia splendens]|uniref:uncharacterized protein LOC121779391 n=1 Tax=Salvia splendens TaxID=180675 RepID=UPI001C27F09E|nr:uncharacterized protein LOC121779391 [Salvia splendens]